MTIENTISIAPAAVTVDRPYARDSIIAIPPADGESLDTRT